MDLTSENQRGDCWDVSCKIDQQKLVELQRREKPTIVIGAIPSSMYKPLINGKSSPPGGQSAEFLAAMYRQQLELGGHFVHEQPAGDSPKAIADLEADDRVTTVDGPTTKIHFD